MCQKDSQCSCGEKCMNNECRSECSSRSICPERQICSKGACIPGCNKDKDCGDHMLCSSKLCQDACDANSCGKKAVCLASRHRAACSCPSGFSGDPLVECRPYECAHDRDCAPDEQCNEDGKCRNVCAGACGLNANCRAVRRHAQCSCPPDFIGNPKIECSKPPTGSCLRNPCGVGARCRDFNDGRYECTCPPNCAGDPHRQCFCGATEACAYKSCGTHAQCRINKNGEAQCYCPAKFPNGDPNIECTCTFFYYSNIRLVHTY